MVTAEIWPTLDYSRVPYRLYHDTEIYRREQERIFKGATWNYLCLDAEIPGPGDFRSSYVGDTPVIVSRDENGGLHAFVNRCAHRGALVQREVSGNTKSHICIYHQWAYGLDGTLKSSSGAAFVARVGSTRASICRHTDYSLSELTMSPGYCSARWPPTLNRSRPISASRSSSKCTACAAERSGCWATPASVSRRTGSSATRPQNTGDNYHASLLHEFLVTFGLDRVTQVGGVTMDARHRHNITWSEANSDMDDVAHTAYADIGVRSDYLKLQEPDLVAFRPERNDQVGLAIVSVFPTLVLAQIGNSLATRQIRTRGTNEHEVFSGSSLFGMGSNDLSLEA